MSEQSLSHAAMPKITGLLARYRELLQNYASLLGGSVGRLVFSLVYFLVLANTLSVAAFGIVAAASSMGVVLSRVAGLGFSSPLYRIATVKPQLTGAYLGGYIGLFLLSLPLVAVLAYVAFATIFAGQLTATAFALMIISEVVLWRSAEIIIIINNGLRRFGLGAALTILGTFIRMCAALAFWKLASNQSVETWAWYYLAANGISLLLICWFGRIKSRIRFVWKLYPRRMRDALSVAAAEIIFYAQMELDKVLMLALAGGEVTGIYAVIMRLVDLTAMPLRAFNTLLVQTIMKTPDVLQSWKRRLAMEGGIALVSILALTAAAVLLWIKPTILGQNIALVAPVLMFALTIPATRNIVEYHSDLLYARGQTFSRAGLLALLGSLKAMLMSQFIDPQIDAIHLIMWMSAVFGALYLVSAGFTYGLIKKPANRV
jgi:O-antigen/teichoic acid export membrane protein